MFFACIACFLIAIVSALCGFGGGPFVVPLLCIAFRLPIHMVAGTSLAAIFCGTVTGSVTHFQLGNFDAMLFYTMAPAVAIGAVAGTAIVKHLSGLTIKRIAGVGMLILAANLLGIY